MKVQPEQQYWESDKCKHCPQELSGVENKQTIKEKNADKTIQYHQQRPGDDN